MIRILQQRENCIGCNACVEIDPDRWRMSRKDGKSTLVGGELKRNFYTVIAPDEELENSQAAAKNCPVSIIQVQVLEKK